MVDTPTLQDPDWKDLNLALNIIAKCGVVPWVLPDAIPDADFFVGLSYTQTVREVQLAPWLCQRLQTLMAVGAFTRRTARRSNLKRRLNTFAEL